LDFEGCHNCEKVNQASVPLSGNYYTQSPFSYFALMECRKQRVSIPDAMFNNVEQQTDSEEDKETDSRRLERNPHFNIPFITYLIRHVFPFRAMMDHELLHLNDLSAVGDNNQTVEAWNKVIKKLEFRKSI
jgi:hypothetical protein